jgi:hypothetical protein
MTMAQAQRRYDDAEPDHDPTDDEIARREALLEGLAEDRADAERERGDW